MARHYLDHASTTPIRREARQAMSDWDHEGVTADPGRVHTEGRMVRAALEAAREQVAGLFGVRPRQVVFTSGGTEAINAAVWGAASVGQGPIACAAVEHSAVREASARAGPLVPIAVDWQGRIGGIDETLERCRSIHGRVPRLVHCQWGNHEVGTLQPVAEVVDRCRPLDTLVHVDAAAAAGHVPIDLGAIGADLVSVSSHKLGGPAGIGALIVGRGIRVDPLLVGGNRNGLAGRGWRM